MSRILSSDFLNQFLIGVLGGILSSLLITSFIIWFAPQLRGKAIEIVTVDQQALKQRFARALAEQNLESSQEEKQIHLFWRTLQQKLQSLYQGKKRIVLTRESTLNMDLKDITEDLWRSVRESIPQTKTSNERGGSQ